MDRNELHAIILDRQTRRLLIGFARRQFGGVDVEDVVQEALVAAARHMDEFEARSSVMRWLRQIVVNAGRMRRRAQNRTRRGGRTVHVSLDDVADPPQWETPERTLLTREALSLVASELSSLPAIDRELLCRFALDDVSLEVLADEANITRAAAKSRMFRARRALSRVDPCVD